MFARGRVDQSGERGPDLGSRASDLTRRGPDRALEADVAVAGGGGEIIGIGVADGVVSQGPD